MQGQEDDPLGSGGTALQWVEVDEPEEASDRPRKRYAIMAVVVALLAVTGAGLLPGAAMAAASFTAGDVTVTSNNGHLDSLTVEPNGTVTYDGLEQEPSSVEVAVQVKTDGTWEAVATDTLSAGGLEGSVSYEVSEVDLLANSGLERTDFHATPGSTTDTTVELRVRATLVGAGPGGDDVTVTGSDSFSVSVQNEKAGGGVGGNANTGGVGR